MEFSHEAMRGIIDTLSALEVANLYEEGKRRGVFTVARASEARRVAVQQLLIDMGHILPFEDTSAIDLGAAEYDEAIAAQALMEDTYGS